MFDVLRLTDVYFVGFAVFGVDCVLGYVGYLTVCKMAIGLRKGF